jgi:hypothetical protein
VLIKQADDQSQLLEQLERLAKTGGSAEVERATKELRRRKGGLKGESESAYLIDFDYAKSANWAVIHDLRIEHDGRVAQIDHLLLNRWMEVYVLESKHFHAGVKITEDGEFLRWNDFRKTYEGMASPLAQNERHIAVLRDAMAEIELPTRLGMRLAPTFYSYVLVASGARIDRPKRFDTSRVIKADQLRKNIWKDIDSDSALILLAKTAKLVSGETVEHVGRQLAARHKPLARKVESAVEAQERRPTAKPEPGAKAVARPTRNAQAAEPTTTTTGPICKKCDKGAGAILYGRFGYYFKCSGCNSNTAIRFTCQPGHNPRLRKDKDNFFRECAECGTSTLFHRNQAGAP